MCIRTCMHVLFGWPLFPTLSKFGSCLKSISTPGASLALDKLPPERKCVLQISQILESTIPLKHQIGGSHRRCFIPRSSHIVFLTLSEKYATNYVHFGTLLKLHLPLPQFLAGWYFLSGRQQRRFIMYPEPSKKMMMMIKTTKKKS